MIWDYRVAAVKRVVDGDTFDLVLHKRIDAGFNQISDWTYAARFRLLGIDAFEANQAGGSSATAFSADWIQAAMLADVLRGVTYKSEGLIPDGSFGRWLIDLYRTDTQEHLVDALRAAGMEKP